MPGAQSIPDGLAEIPPGPGLAVALAGLDLSRLSGYDCVEVLKARYRQLSHERAQLMAAMVEVGSCRSGPDELARMAVPDEFSADEIRAALVLTRRAAEDQFWLAHDLLSRLPAVHAAMDAGRLDEPRARVLSDWTTGLTGEQARAICDTLLPRASKLTTGQLIEQIKKMAIAVDPDWARRRYEEAVAERKVVGFRNPDGSANLSGQNLPVDRVAAACGRINALAKAAKHAGDQRPIDHIRAELFLGMTDGTYTGLDDAAILHHLRTTQPTDDGNGPDDGGPDGRSPDGGSSGDDRGPDSSGPDGPDGGGSDGGGSDDSGSDGGGSDGGGSDGGGSDGGGSDDSGSDDSGSDDSDPVDGDPVDGGPDDSRSGGGLDGDGEPAGKGVVCGSADSGGPAQSADAAVSDQAGQRGQSGAGMELRARLSTLLGRDAYPGELAGWGPVHAELARDLVYAMAGGQWRFVLTDAQGRLLHCGITRARPAGWPARAARSRQIVELQIPVTVLEGLAGDLATLGDWAPVLGDLANQFASAPRSPGGDPARRSPGAALRRWIEIRDRYCVMVGCRAPAHGTDLDHTFDHVYGGPTAEHNLDPACRHDHRLKHQGGWQLHQPQPGRYRWTSRLGHTYQVHPPPIIEPLPDPVAGYELPPPLSARSDDGWADSSIWDDTLPDAHTTPPPRPPPEPDAHDEPPPF